MARGDGRTARRGILRRGTPTRLPTTRSVTVLAATSMLAPRRGPMMRAPCPELLCAPTSTLLRRVACACVRFARVNVVLSVLVARPRPCPRYLLCGNGVQDAAMGETGVDCGGPNCPLKCGPTFSSEAVASSGDSTCQQPSFTATFATAVAGVTVTDFGLNDGGLTDYSLTLTQRSAPNDNQWVLDVNVQSGFTDSVLSVAMDAAAAATVSPPHQAATNNGFSVSYQPPAPVFSSSIGPSGSATASTTFTFTATFPAAVSGITAEDFGVTSSAPVSFTAVVDAVPSGQASSDTWVLTVNIGADPVDATFEVTMPEGVTGGECRNAPGANNGFAISFAADPCLKDPCGLAQGGYASSCSVIDAVAGTYQCACLDGR